MATLTKGKTFGATESVTNAKLHSLVDDGSVTGIVNNDISSSAAIAESKINFSGTTVALLSTNQTIAGVKTFSSFPVTPSSAPTSDYQTANKKYVDDEIDAIMSTDGTLSDDSDTVCPTEKAVKTYVDTCAPATTCLIATGTYTGDGSESQSITGLGFQPKYLRIWPHLTNAYVIEKLDQTWGVNAFFPEIHTFAGNSIIAFSTDGFTVDDAGTDAHPNKNGQVYDYLAIGATG